MKSLIIIDIICILLMVALAFIMPGCGDVKVGLPSIAKIGGKSHQGGKSLESNGAELIPAGKVSAAEAKLNQDDDEIRFAKSKVRELEEKRATDQKRFDDEKWQWAHTLAHWLVGAAIVLGLVAVGMAIWRQSLTFAGLALACLGMVVCGFFTDWVIDHRTLATYGILAVAGIAGVLFFWHMRRGDKALGTVVRVAESLKPEIETEAERGQRILMQSRIVKAAGKSVGSLIERARASIDRAAKKI